MVPVHRPTSVLTASLAIFSLLLAACGGDDGTEPMSAGEIRASVTADGEPRAGIELGLFATGSTSAEATRTTDSDGSVRFDDVEPGAWEVEIELPDGLALPPGTPLRQSVNVSSGGTAQVAWALESDADDEVVEIVLTGNLTFSPSTVTISPGTTVRWRNAENIFHTVTPDGHSEWSRATFDQAGDVFTHTFTSAGTFDYFCEPHLSAGMTGQVIVQ